MSETLTVLKALADDTRIKILRALCERDMYVELLAERLQLTPATVSFHMKKLTAAGLVDYFRGDELVVINMQPTRADRSASLCIAAPIGRVLDPETPVEL